MIAQKTNPKEAQAKLEHQELRAVRHPTNIDKIRNAVPPAVNVLPENSLPGWKNYPLEKKFPRVPANKHEFVFGRNAIGEKIFVSGCDFDLDDPHMQATPRGYESLHDPHLKSYFLKHPEVFEKLVEQGFVERDGSVNTSLKEFNQYRAYLGRMRNCVVEGDLGYQDGLAKQQRSQMKRIAELDRREKGRAKDEVKSRHLAALRRQQDRRQLRAQLKDTKFFQRVREKEREAAINVVKREALAQKVRARLAKLRRAERRRARRIMLEWYCRQLYADMMRKALREHKKEVREKDLDSFINAKREYQELKLKWLDNLREKRDAERECAGKHRRLLLDKIESGRRERMKKKALEDEFQAMKEIYLAKKFGKRWLTAVREQRKYAQNYHDSVWRVRQQLVEMVQELKNESGRVNFDSFIKGLIKLKPGRGSQDVSEETREIMNYILDLLIKTAFETYRKNHKACEKAYEDLHNRRRILGVKDLTEDDFKEPAFKVRDRVRDRLEVPFHRPYLPCDHVCTKIGNKRYVEDPECEEERERLRLLREAEELACEEIERVCGREGLGKKGGKGKKRSKEKKGGKGGKKMHNVGRKGDQSSDSSAVAERVSKGALKKGVGRVMTATSGDSSDVAGRVVGASLKKAVKDLACDEDEEWGGEGVGEVPRTGMSGDSSDVAGRVVSESLLRAIDGLVCDEDEEWGGECEEDEEWGGECVEEDKECFELRRMGSDVAPGSEFSGFTSEDATKIVTSSLRNVVSDLACDEDEGDGVTPSKLFPGEWGGEGLDEVPSRIGTGVSGDSSDVAGRVVSESLLKAVSSLTCVDEEWEGEGEDEGVGGDRGGDGRKSGRSEGVTSSSGSSGGVDKVVSDSLRKAVSDLSCPEDGEDGGDDEGLKGEGVGDDAGKGQKSGRSEGVTSSSGSSGGANKVVAESLRKAVSDLTCPEDEEGDDGGDKGGLGGEDRGDKGEDGKSGKSGRSEKSTSGSSSGADKVVSDSLRKAVSDLSCPEDEEEGEGLAEDGGDGKSGRSEKSSSGSSGSADKVVSDSLKKAVSDLSCVEDEDDKNALAGDQGEDKSQKSGRSEKSTSGSSGGADKVVAESLRKAVSELSCVEDDDEDGDEVDDEYDQVPPLTAIEREDWERGKETGRSTESSEEAKSLVAESVKCAVDDLACVEEEGSGGDDEGKDGSQTGRSSGSSEEAKSLVTDSVKCAVGDLACEEDAADWVTPDSLFDKSPESGGDGPGEVGKSGPETGRSSGSSEEAKSLVADSLKCAVGDLACEEQEAQFLTTDSLFGKGPESGGDGPGEVGGDDGKSGSETGRSSGSSADAKSLVADSLHCAVSDLECEGQESGESPESGGDGSGKSGPETGRSSGSSEEAKSLVAESVKCAVDDLACEEGGGGGKKRVGDGAGKEPKSGRSEGTSSSGGSDGVDGVVGDSLKKAMSDLSCPEEDDKEEDGGVGDGAGKEPKSGRSEGTTSSEGSDGVNGLVGDSLNKAVSDLSCPEDDEEEGGGVGKEGIRHGAQKEPKSGRSEGTSSSGGSDGVNGLVGDSLNKAVSDLSCPEDEDEEGGGVGKEGIRDGAQKEPKSGRSEGTSSSGGSDGVNGLVGDSLNKAVSDLSCPEDEDEEEDAEGRKKDKGLKDAGNEPKSGRSEGNSSNGSSSGANDVVENSLRKAVSDLSCVEDDEQVFGDACEEVEEGCEEDDEEFVAKENNLKKRPSDIPGLVLSAVTSEEAESLVASSLRNAVSDLACPEEDGVGNGVGDSGRRPVGDDRGGMGEASGEGSAGSSPGSQGSPHQDDCSSLLDVMAKEIAFSVLPGSSVSSSYFREIDSARRYSGPVFPLDGGGRARSDGDVERRSGGDGGRRASDGGGIGSRLESGSRPGSGGGSRPPSGTQPVGSLGGGAGAGPSGTTPPRQVPSRPGSGGSGSPLGMSARRLPSDMRENVLRTLSNVQHQLDAIRQELRNYGVIPRGDQGGNSGGR